MTSIQAKHILVETEEEARRLYQEVVEGKDFDGLAMTHSKCPSGQSGGNLGQFGRGQMVKPFEDAAFGLEIGKYSEPVQTQFGWHVIQRTG